MADPKGFLKIKRQGLTSRNIDDRLKDYHEVYHQLAEETVVSQASRCMDCGVPFCNHGCPLGNLIPDFNAAVYHKNWQIAYEILIQTNNFPEFTGRICPAPCEASCVLGIHDQAVTIENIEKQIIEKAFENGWVSASTKKKDTGKKIAVVGSGPAGLAAADQLNKAGHRVTVYEKNDFAGGLLRYGIPDFKLEKWVVERRIALLEQAGIQFVTNAHIGQDIDIDQLLHDNNTVLLCGGSSVPRDIQLKGRDAKGIHFAMDFLEQSNRYVHHEFQQPPDIYTKGKNVVVIGGGDTGADCVGTSNRQGAASVTQIELLFKPGLQRTDKDPWPLLPMVLRTSSSHEEGCQREWSIQTKKFIKDDLGNLTGLEVEDIEWTWNEDVKKYTFTDIPETTRVIQCDMIFIAAGFLHPQKEGIIDQLGLQLDERGNVATTQYQTNLPNVFAAGDIRRGQSLVVWAISEGREAARAIDHYLMGYTSLDGKNTNTLVMA